MRLKLHPRRKKNTVLGFPWIEPISYGYDQAGHLASMFCKGEFSDGSVGPLILHEPEISEDLIMNYVVEEN
jgi:hypothetical protein